MLGRRDFWPKFRACRMHSVRHAVPLLLRWASRGQAAVHSKARVLCAASPWILETCCHEAQVSHGRLRTPVRILCHEALKPELGRTSETLSMIMRAPGCTQMCWKAPVKSGLCLGFRATFICCARSSGLQALCDASDAFAWPSPGQLLL